MKQPGRIFRLTGSLPCEKKPQSIELCGKSEMRQKVAARTKV